MYLTIRERETQWIKHVYKCAPGAGKANPVIELRGTAQISTALYCLFTLIQTANKTELNNLIWSKRLAKAESMNKTSDCR